MKISTCPSCGSRRMKKIKGSLEIRIKKKILAVPGLEYHRCDNCGETLTDVENEKRIDAYLSKSRRQAA